MFGNTNICVVNIDIVWCVLFSLNVSVSFDSESVNHDHTRRRNMELMKNILEDF